MLHEKWFIHLFNRAGIFTDRGGDRTEPNRAAIEFLDDRFEQTGIHVIESEMIDVVELQRGLCHLQGNAAIRTHLRVVTHATQ